MREHTVVVDFKAGLREDKESAISDTRLSYLSGLVPSDDGLVLPTEISNVYPSLTRDWPFPVAFEGLKQQFALSSTQLYVDSVPQSFYTFPAANPASFVLTDLPHYVEFGGAFLVTDGNVCLFKSNNEDYEYLNYVLSEPKVKTVCYHKGRVLLGGVSQTSNMWSEDSPRLVFWSTIGGGDAFELLIGELRGDTTRMDSAIEQNLFGWTNPGVGPILRLFPLGQHVIVFGEYGVAVLTFVREAVATYGCSKVFDIGIRGRNHACGDDSMVVFEDGRNVLWAISQDLSINRLGFSEYTETLSEPVFLYHAGRREFYFTDRQIGYVFTKNGLGSSLYKPSSVLPSFQGVGATCFGAPSGVVELAVEGVDFNRLNDGYVASLRIQGMRRLEFVTLEQRGFSDLYVTVTAEYPNGDVVLRPVPMAPNNTAYIGADGTNFKIHVSGVATTATPVISRMVIKYQYADARSHREGK